MPTTRNDPQELLSIGDLADLSGITPDTIRIWERRYGKPVAVRLPSGHRRYTREQALWLRRMAEAIARGHRPGKLMRITDRELDSILRPEEPAQDDRVLRRMMEAIRRYRDRDLRDLLREEMKRLETLAFLETRVAPLLEQTGREWADGHLDVRHEHFASEVIEDVLRSHRISLPTDAAGPLVILATLSGERHRLGLQMAALICVQERARPWILGADTPAPEIVRTVRELRAPAVGISVSLASGGVENDRALAGLRELLPPEVSLVVGGGGARGARRGPRGVDYVEGLAGFGRWCRDLRESLEKRTIA